MVLIYVGWNSLPYNNPVNDPLFNATQPIDATFVNVGGELVKKPVHILNHEGQFMRCQDQVNGMPHTEHLQTDWLSIDFVSRDQVKKTTARTSVSCLSVSTSEAYLSQKISTSACFPVQTANNARSSDYLQHRHMYCSGARTKERDTMGGQIWRPIFRSRMRSN